MTAQTMILQVMLCLMTPVPAQPNNLGPMLLIALGMITVPIGFGILLLLVALALLREADGRLAFPSLSRRVARVYCFFRFNRLA